MINPGAAAVRRRAATVSAVDGATRAVTVTWADAATTTDLVPCLASYTPVVGDVVLVDLVAGSPVIVGRATVSPAITAVADVTTAQSTTSTTYTDLTTAGPAVTVILAANHPALVLLSCEALNATNASQRTWMGFAVSGAQTAAAADVDAARKRIASINDDTVIFRPVLYPGGAAGACTFTAKYRCDGTGGTWQNRRIIVTPL